MDTNQGRIVARAINFFYYFSFVSFLVLSCKKKDIGADSVEQVKPDSVEQLKPDSVWIFGRAGIYYNDDIVSTPPKEAVLKFTDYHTRVDTLRFPNNARYLVGVFGYSGIATIKRT